MSFPQPSNQCIDPSEMENWVDFNAMPSPAPASRASTSQAPSAMTSPTSTIVPLDVGDDHQTPVAPSHEYARFKQQTGIPSGSMASLRALSESSSQGFSGFSNTGLGDNFDMFDGMGSMTGLDEMEFSSSSNTLPAFFFPPGEGSQGDDFVDPTAITKQEEAQANIRFYPGMHQQQAAIAKAQAQAQQQRQQQLIQQQQKQREAEQQQRQSVRRSASHQPVDAHTEETIARVVNQIRQNSTFAGDSLSPNSHNVLPHVVKTKKDEDDMDEDERLLNSEEGKKLSSKERRQLRNKVSARAFRSRRKGAYTHYHALYILDLMLTLLIEYISQLESEIATKTQEANELKLENRALTEENARFRNLAEKLLRHPAFHPFLDDLSRDPALAESLSKVAGTSIAPQQQKDVDPYTAQHFIPQPDNQHVGMALVPEPQLDFSSLNLGGNANWAMQQAHGLPMFQQPQVFAVLELPEPEPLDLSAMSGKSAPALPSLDEDKAEYPVLEPLPTVKEDLPAPVTADQPRQDQQWCFDDNDDSVALFANSSRPAAPQPSEPASFDLSQKPHFELVLVTDEDNARLAARLEKMVAKVDVTVNRIASMISRFEL